MHLSKNLLCLSLMQAFALSAVAIDLGRPLMLSKQSEPLKIEIPLSASNPEELKDLQVGIASSSTYQSKLLGEEASSLISIGAKARLTKNTKGLNTITITSDKPASQSFLSLLIELQWQTGSELKEIGVLLDTNTRALAPKENTTLVTEGDTASAIAQRYATAPITYEQMLFALLKANPKSFVNQNINRLRADTLLTIPTNAQALSINIPQAREELKAQNLDFEQYRQSLAAKIKKTSSSAVQLEPQSASGLISPKVQVPTAKNQDELKLSKPNSKGAKASEQAAKELQTQQTLKETSQVNQNLKELGQIAEQKTSNPDPTGLGSPGMSSFKSSMSQWLQNPLSPVLAGSFFGFLVLLALWKTRDRQGPLSGSDDEVDPLSRPSSIFDIETPIPSSLRVSAKPFKPLGPEVTAQKEVAIDEDELEFAQPDANVSKSAGSLKDHVNIDFDLELPAIDEPTKAPESEQIQDGGARGKDSENPLQVRFDLAHELWQVGQQHTARAIVQEVAQQASGELLQQAQAWLTERE